LKVKEKRYYFSLQKRHSSACERDAHSRGRWISCIIVQIDATGAEGRAELCVELISWALSAWTARFSL